MAGIVTRSTPHLALIGSGPIAHFHVDAARRAGFLVTDVAGRPGSTRAPAFAAQHGIARVWDDPAQLAADGAWDALILAVETAATLPLLTVAAERDRPVLVEKPVALSSAALAPLRSRWDHVLVAYNRRYYEPVQAARAWLRDRGPCLVQLELPDAVAPEDDGTDRTTIVRINSVHGLDLLRYLLGDLRIESVASLGDPGAYAGRHLTLRSARGDLCSLTANWNAPANFSLAFDAGAERFQLRPFEVGATYRGMEVVEPTPAMPIRRYQPVCTGTVWADASNGKPGFVGQAKALRRLVEGAPPGPEAATMNDACEAVVLVEALVQGAPTAGHAWT